MYIAVALLIHTFKLLFSTPAIAMPPQKRSRDSVGLLRKRARVETYDTQFQPTSGNTTQQLPRRLSPRKCLTIAASLALELSTFKS
jgi:hypothetical protein